MISTAFAWAACAAPAFSQDLGFVQRPPLIGPSLEYPFLGLAEVIDGPTADYNCIGYSLGVRAWMWPGASLAAFDQLNARFGYFRVALGDYTLVPGVDKIVLYGKFVNGTFEATHQARQLQDGTWASKMGIGCLIRHQSPDSLYGPAYGAPVAVYCRAR
jgi:type VI secretion system secreted protein VgrG